MRQLIINTVTEQERLALMENGRLAEIYIKETQSQIRAGNIYRGRVRNVRPGLQAAFVDLGNGINGYLHRNDVLSYIETVRKDPQKQNANISSFIHEGEEVIVQVIKEGNEHKSPKLSMNLELKSSALVYKPHDSIVAISKKITSTSERKRLECFAKSVLNDEGGLIIRTEAQQLSNEELHHTFYYLTSLFEKVLKKKNKIPELLHGEESFVDQVIKEISPITIDEIIYDQYHLGPLLKKIVEKNKDIRLVHYKGKEDIFSYYLINEEIIKALKKIVWLKNGSFIVIEQTEAMNVIDVNTGKFLGKYAYRDTILKTNKEAAIEIARQIRLRNLSGIILIDFIDMKNEEDREMIIQLLKEELKKDRIYTKIIGFTELNILQLTRKKMRKSLTELITDTCHICHGTGRVESKESIAFSLERILWQFQNRDIEAILVEANPKITELFEEDFRSYLLNLEQQLRIKIFLWPSTKVDTFHIPHYGTIQEVEEKISRFRQITNFIDN